MSDVERLLSEYIQSHKAGEEANPLAYLDQVSGTDREELAALIDGYLQRTPAAEWDPDAYRGSEAERMVQSLTRSLTGQAGVWPVLLPSLRARAEVKRSELVARLAEALGVGDRREKVAGYYHRMEQGSLDAGGVSARVLEALGGIVGASAESLRRAGEAAAGRAGMAAPGEPAFTRMQHPAPEYAQERAAEERAPEAGAEDWDEVDELFRGGG